MSDAPFDSQEPGAREKSNHYWSDHNQQNPLDVMSAPNTPSPKPPPIPDSAYLSSYKPVPVHPRFAGVLMAFATVASMGAMITGGIIRADAGNPNEIDVLFWFGLWIVGFLASAISFFNLQRAVAYPCVIAFMIMTGLWTLRVFSQWNGPVSIMVAIRGTPFLLAAYAAYNLRLKG